MSSFHSTEPTELNRRLLKLGPSLLKALLWGEFSDGKKEANSQGQQQKQVFNMLPIATSIKDAATFAWDILGLKPSAYSNITSGDPIPDARIHRLEEEFRRRFTTFRFDVAHLDLRPEEFVELFERETVYDELKRFITPAVVPPPPPPHPLQRFFGVFAGIYLCRDERNKSKNCVALEVYNISEIASDRSTAHIEQLTKPFSGQKAFGVFRIRNDTIEININFHNQEYPDSLFMGSAPIGNKIKAFLCINIDIRWDKHRVVAQPALFVKIEDDIAPSISRLYSDETELYARAKDIFDNYVDIEPSRLELIPKMHLEENDEDNIENVVCGALRQEIEAGKLAEERD